jgi:hypothetical protein
MLRSSTIRHRSAGVVPIGTRATDQIATPNPTATMAAAPIGMLRAATTR